MRTPSPTRVFIVDDAPAVLERLREYVDGIAGAVVVGDAGTPEDAIAGIRRTEPACVLLDYQLEGGTGVDVLRALRTQSPSTVFIVLTNHADAQYRRACLAAGANHFFDKTTEFESVGTVIRGMRGDPTSAP
ncbi:MAG TPA: response regulator transcription factor [Casimicrobiaceae bacterium]